jgi:hypothetical protein
MVTTNSLSQAGVSPQNTSEATNPHIPPSLSSDFQAVLRGPIDLSPITSGPFKQQVISQINDHSDLAQEQLTNIDQTQTRWNNDIIKGLGIPDQIAVNEKSGFKLMSQEQLSLFQTRSLVRPDKINEEVWQTVPCYFESRETSDGNWQDNRHPGEGVDAFENLQNTEENASTQLEEINSFFRVFAKVSGGYNYKTLDTLAYEEETRRSTPPIFVSDAEMQPLLEKRKELEERVQMIQEADEQIDKTGDSLRTGKTVQRLFEEPSYLEDKFITPYIDALESAAFPQDKLAILQSLKSKITDFLGNVLNSANAATGELPDNGTINGVPKELIEKVTGEIIQRVQAAFEGSFGDYLVSSHNEITEISPLTNHINPLPTEGEENLPNNLDLSTLTNSNLRGAYENLFGLFADVADGKTQLTFEALAPIAAQIQRNDKSLNPGVNLEENHKLNSEPDLMAADRQDLGHMIIDYSKQAFDEISSRRKEDHNNLLLSFVPFTRFSNNPTDRQRQFQLEQMLDSPRFQKLYNLPQTGEVNWSVSLLSRIKYLWEQYKQANRVNDRHLQQMRSIEI